MSWNIQEGILTVNFRHEEAAILKYLRVLRVNPNNLYGNTYLVSLISLCPSLPNCNYHMKVLIRVQCVSFCLLTQL